MFQMAALQQVKGIHGYFCKILCNCSVQGVVKISARFGKYTDTQ